MVAASPLHVGWGARQRSTRPCAALGDPGVPSPPTAQMSDEDNASTSLSIADCPELGLGTTLHPCPFQCSTSVVLGSKLELSAVQPTAHTSFGAATDIPVSALA